MNEPYRGSGQLVLVATPIGNLEDLSPRAARVLCTADVVAAEDTRHTGRLLQHARELVGPESGGRRPRMVSYHEHNETVRGPELLGLVAEGQTVAVVSDAGTPGIADPGYRLVADAVAADLAVGAVPGPSAALQALLLSGLPTDRFAFEGFLPRKQGARSRRLAELAADPRTLVLYAAPHRVAEELGALSNAFGADRRAALTRELTKRFEEVWHGTLGELASRAAEGVKGEVTLVIGGADDEPQSQTWEELLAAVAERVATGTSRRDAVAQLAAESTVSRRELYQAVIEGGRGEGGRGA